MKENYEIERTCNSCGNQQILSVSKRDAAFELVDYNQLLGQQCEKCSQNKFITTFRGPKLDFDLLSEWSKNSELHLMPQDEELLLADEMYLELVLQVLDSGPILDSKRNLLMDALCVIVYDNTVDDNHQKDEKLKDRVLSELNKRRDELRLADEWIMDYLKDVVYPQLDEN